MDTILIDSNILLDVITNDKIWGDLSSRLLEKLAEEYRLAINPIIYAEVSVGFKLIESLENALPHNYFERRPIPWESAFLAGKCFMKYKKRGGQKSSTLPDFFIGAHAAVESLGLATRDVSRYETYFPSVNLFTPER